MASITIFLNLGMQGLGTKTFLNVNVNETINSFLKTIADQEGALGCDWIRTGTKVITGTTHGDKTLADFGFYHEITLWGSLRLRGGAEQISSMFKILYNKFSSLDLSEKKLQFDAKKIKSFGASVVNKSCVVCMTKALNAKLPCECVYCCQCMHDLIERETKNSSSISCCICKSNIESILAFEVAAYSDKQKSVADKQLFKNSLKTPDSMMSECASCKNIIMKKGINGNKLQCSACQKYTCQICKLSWINNDNNDKTYCGNSVCDPSVMYQTFLDHATDKEINGVTVTDTRFCPKCLKVNIHEIACKHITCPCKHEYCHICLQDWNGHQADSCEVKLKQPITKEMVLKLAKQ